MILCLAHDSVFLSFLSFSPFTKIKHLSDPALAVQKGDYQCLSYADDGVADYFLNANEENLKVIGNSISKNNIRIRFVEKHFFAEKKKNYAFFTDTEDIDFYREKFFVSEDRFYSSMYAFCFRKNFNLKVLLNTFIHRFMASGTRVS